MTELTDPSQAGPKSDLDSREGSHTSFANPWRRRRLAKRTLRAFAALLLFAVLFGWIGHVRKLNLDRPFEYTGDALEMLSYYTHDYIANDFDTRMRAPFELSQPENIHYLYNALFQSNSNLIWFAKLIGHGDAARTLNIAYLLTYLLVFWSAYWACGRLGLRKPFRFFAASLYALMPYHFLRAEHHFWESSYYFTPILAVVLVQLWSARPLAHEWGGTGWKFSWRDRRAWLAVLVLVFLSSYHPYHQFFFACLAASAAPFAAVYRGSWRHLTTGLALAFIACAVLVFKGAIAHLMAAPGLGLSINNQPITVYGGAEVYPLKLTQLLLPVEHHRWHVLAALRELYDTANPLNNENSTTTLGLVGAVGMLSCVSLALVPRARLQTSRLGKMGLIILMALLFASMGGISSLISTLSAVLFGPDFLLTQARGWDRIVIYIGFFAYFAAFWTLQGTTRALSRHVRGKPARTWLIWIAGFVVFAFAIWDQVPYRITQQQAGHYLSDKQFFGKLETQLPAKARIFQLPFVLHHWSGFVLPGVYYTEELRPYIASRALHFTYGGDRSSAQAEWLRAASALPADQAARYLCSYDFAGVLLQRNMLKEPSALQGQWQAVLGEAPEISKDGDYAFFRLGSFCQTHGIRPLDMRPLKAQLLQELRQVRRFLPGGAFEHLTGHVFLASDGRVEIRAGKDEQGYVAYGPYEMLTPGRYRAVFEFSTVSNDDKGRVLTLDVAVQTLGKPRVLTSTTLRPPSGSGVVKQSLDFVIGRDDEGVQYRVVKTYGIGLDFVGVKLQKIPD